MAFYYTTFHFFYCLYVERNLYGLEPKEIKSFYKLFDNKSFYIVVFFLSH